MNEMSSSLSRKVELICPRCWTTRTHRRWTKRKLVMSQGEVIKERHPIVKFRFCKTKVVLEGEIQKALMFKLRKNGRSVKNSLTMSKRMFERMKMCSH